MKELDDDILNDDLINSLIGEDISDIPVDDEADLEPPINIDLEGIDKEAQDAAVMLTDRLSGYYFDQEYLDQHPYIPVKIATEMNNVRRLMKMLAINEKGQDILIGGICKGSVKKSGMMFNSLTQLQNGMLNVQRSLDALIESLENTFKRMQEECEKTWADKEKEQAEDGSFTVRGSKDFIKEMQNKLWGKKLQQNVEENENKQQSEQEIA